MGVLRGFSLRTSFGALSQQELFALQRFSFALSMLLAELTRRWFFVAIESERLDQRFNRQTFVETRHGDLFLECVLQLGHHLNGEQRVSAQFKEIIVDADWANAERTLPDVRDGSLRLSGRSNKDILQWRSVVKL